jgi:Putative transposase
MLTWAHDGGFSLDASIVIPAHERDALERRLRYCAQPAFAQERLRQIDASRYRHAFILAGSTASTQTH